MQKIKQLRGINCNSDVAISADFITQQQKSDQKEILDVSEFTGTNEPQKSVEKSENVQNGAKSTPGINDNQNEDYKQGSGSVQEVKKVYPTSQPSTPRKV